MTVRTPENSSEVQIPWFIIAPCLLTAAAAGVYVALGTNIVQQDLTGNDPSLRLFMPIDDKTASDLTAEPNPTVIPEGINR